MSNASCYWQAYQTMLLKELGRIARMWQIMIFAPTISMALYFIIFGNLIGPRIGTMQGVDYIAYIAPGLIMMAVINNAYAHSSSNLFLARLQRSIEEILVAPIPNSLLLLGYISGGIIRGLIVGVSVTIVALFFTQLHMHNIVITTLTVLLASILFSLGGLINGLLARTFDDIGLIPTFVLTPLTYLGGVFYSINLLPDFWREVSAFNPILYMVNAFRYGILGISDVSLLTAFAVLIGSILLLFSLSLHLLKKGTGIRT